MHGREKSCLRAEIFCASQTPYNDDMRCCFRLLLLWLIFWSGLQATAQTFDLAGPKVDVHVKRGLVTLPIGEVPNLLPGDRLWIHPDLPESQSAHYVLVVAFLRGVTNPPPPEWFTRVETWTREAREEGVFVIVPQRRSRRWSFLRRKRAATSAPCATRCEDARAFLSAQARICRRPAWTGCGWMPIWPK